MTIVNERNPARNGTSVFWALAAVGREIIANSVRMVLIIFIARAPSATIGTLGRTG